MFQNLFYEIVEKWIRLFQITPSQLAVHNKRQDAWLAVRGRVYNITEYLPFHPGGEEELMKGAGKDATTLFDQVCFIYFNVVVHDLFYKEQGQKINCFKRNRKKS